MVKVVKSCSIALLMWPLLVAQVRAHGPQMQLTGSNGTMVTREIIPDEPYSTVLTSPKSVYVLPVLPYNGVHYARPNGTPDPLEPSLPLYYSGPGFAYGYDQATGGPQVFAVGSQLAVGFTTGLTRWDGAAFADAGPVELEAFAGALAVKTTDGAASAILAFPNGGFEVDYGTAGVNAHSTVRYRFLGNGTDPLIAPPDGVYLATLQLSSSDAAMQASAPYHFVLHKNAPLSEIQSAVDALGVDPALVQYVPEPGWTALIAPVVLLGMSRRTATRLWCWRVPVSGQSPELRDWREVLHEDQ